MHMTSRTLLGGRYQLVERLAGGGMGEVWRAEDQRLSRQVAVKVLRPEYADNDEFRERLRIGEAPGIGAVPRWLSPLDQVRPRGLWLSTLGGVPLPVVASSTN